MINHIYNVLLERLVNVNFFSALSLKILSVIRMEYSNKNKSLYSELFSSDMTKEKQMLYASAFTNRMICNDHFTYISFISCNFNYRYIITKNNSHVKAASIFYFHISVPYLSLRASFADSFPYSYCE